jgi:hypothetical protein
LLQKSYQENYNIHPAFIFNQTPLKIDNKRLTNFNSVIGKSRDRICESEVLRSKMLLDEIFSDLVSQASNDAHLKLFLLELCRLVQIYLDEEFMYRKRVSKSWDSDERASKLETSAFYYDCLSDELVERISDLVMGDVQVFRERASQGLLKRSDLSKNEGVTVSRVSKLLSEEFRKNGTLKSVSKYVGIRYSYVGVSLELSVSGSTWWKNTIPGVETPKTMYAHLDESIYAPKAIVYLSNVTKDNGPTSSYPLIYDQLNNNTLQDIIGRVVGSVGNDPESSLFDYYKKSYHQSMSSREFREHFMKLPSELRFNSHFGWDVLAGSEFEGEISKREEILVGPPGTYVVFDGSRLLHRGGLIEQGERIVLQVVFWPAKNLTSRLLGIPKRTLRKFLISRSKS